MRRVLLVLGIVAVLASCSAHSQAPGPTPMDRGFVSTNVQGAPIPGGGPLELNFADGRLAATAGCNRATAAVDLSGGTIAIGELATTMMACPSERAGADEWMASLLRARPSWTVDRYTLTITSGDRVVTLLDRTVANPDRPLLGTDWVVHSLVDPTAVRTSAALERAAPWLRLEASDSVTGSTGCNNFAGPAAVTRGAPTTIEFGALAITRRACDPEVADIERFVLGVLSDTVQATVYANELRLHKTDGTGLILTAR